MTHINQRRDSAANWAFYNPVLQDGELGWERDTKKAKMGNGTDDWNTLPYIVTGEVTSINGQIGDVVLPVGVSSVNGQTGAVTIVSDVNSVNTQTGHVVLTKGDLGLDQVDNTSDTDKPVSTAVTAAIASAVSAALLAAHPIGSIYMSADSTNPASLFGGAWAPWGQGRVPVSVNTSETEFNAVEKTGGVKTNTLDTANLPSHTHSIPSHSHSTSNHKHDLEAGFNTRQNLTTGGSTQYVYSWSFTGSGNNVTMRSGSSANAGSGSTGNWSGTTGSRGSGTPVDNLQPYITCYMWKRVS